MSTKKNLIVPKLKKQTLGKINPQKAEYLYISRDFCKSGFAQILKDGGEQFKEIQKFINNPREPQYILVHASKLEEGYLAISLLAGIYNEINQRGAWEDGMSDGNEKTEPLAPPPQSLASSGQRAGNASPLFHIMKPTTIITGMKTVSLLLAAPSWPVRKQTTPLFLTGQKMRTNRCASP